MFTSQDSDSPVSYSGQLAFTLCARGGELVNYFAFLFACPNASTQVRA